MGQWDFDRDKLANFINDNNVDLIQTVTFRNFQGALAAQLLKIPHIWHLEGNIKQIYPHLKERQVNNILRIIYSASKKIVACSNFVKSQFKGVDSYRKIIVIHNGINIPRSCRDKKKDKYEFRKKLGLNRKNISIGMACRIDPQKRIKDFIDAAWIVKKTFPEAIFILAGAETTVSYLREIKAYNRNKNSPVNLSGFCKDMGSFMASIDLLVSSSVGEASSLAALEAMAYGKPVVAVNSGAMPEIVIHKKTGILVCPESPSALARAISTLMQDCRTRDKMGSLARERAKGFDIKHTVSSFQKLYLEVLGVKK